MVEVDGSDGGGQVVRTAVSLSMVTELAFEPGEPAGGSYEADIGTAGSITLLYDTLLPVAT